MHPVQVPLFCQVGRRWRDGLQPAGNQNVRIAAQCYRGKIDASALRIYLRRIQLDLHFIGGAVRPVLQAQQFPFCPSGGVRLPGCHRVLERTIDSYFHSQIRRPASYIQVQPFAVEAPRDAERHAVPLASQNSAFSVVGQGFRRPYRVGIDKIGGRVFRYIARPSQCGHTGNQRVGNILSRIILKPFAVALIKMHPVQVPLFCQVGRRWRDGLQPSGNQNVRRSRRHSRGLYKHG